MQVALTTRQIERCIRNNQWDQAIAGVLEYPPTARQALKPHIDAIGRYLIHKGHNLIDLEAPHLPSQETDSTSYAVRCLEHAWSIHFKLANLGYSGHESEAFIKKLHTISLGLVQGYLNNAEPGRALDWIERIGASGCTAPRLKLHNDLSEHWIRALNLSEIDMIPEALNHAREALQCPSAMAHPAVAAHLEKLIGNLESRRTGPATNTVMSYAASEGPPGMETDPSLSMAPILPRQNVLAKGPPESNQVGTCFCLWINGMGGYLCLFEEIVLLGNIYSPKAHVHLQAHMHESHASICRAGPIMHIQPTDDFCPVYINDQRIPPEGQILQNQERIRFDDWNPRFELKWHQFEESGTGGMLLPSESRRMQPGIERVILESSRIAIGPDEHCAIRTSPYDLKKNIYLVRDQQHVLIVVPEGVDHHGARRVPGLAGTPHVVGNLSFSLTHAYESNTTNW